MKMMKDKKIKEVKRKKLNMVVDWFLNQKLDSMIVLS